VLAESDEEATDTPMSSPHDRSSHAKRRKVSSDDEAASPEPAAGEKNVTSSSMMLDDDEDEDEDDVPAVRPARQRVRAGFIVDSSDEE
jgi:replication fork protection complex subunit Tof1/Swi1